MKCYFYPNKPIGQVINGILGALGWTKVKSAGEADLIFWWKFTSEYEPTPMWININANCNSTMKRFVEKRFIEAFGEETLVNPMVYKGMIAEKHDRNAVKAIKIIECPIETAKPEKVYQKIFHTKKNGLYRNYRVPVIGGEIPYVVIQYKNDMFQGEIGGAVVKTEVVESLSLFSSVWLEKLKNFCKGYIDIGELDVVDRYIVDVNNVPSRATYNNMPNEIRKNCMIKAGLMFKKYVESIKK